MSKFGRSESAWRDTSVVPPATNRCSIWSTILTCWSASRGRWPESFDRLWQSLRERHGPQAGTRAMIELLGLGKRYGWDRLREAIKESLALGCTDAAAVRHLVTANELVRSHTEPFELSGLERYDRPLPQMQEYDLLLSLTTTGAEVAR